MANDMELQLSFSYDKNDLNNMLAQMENAIESADLDPNITGNTKKQLQDFQKEIQKFVKQTTKDFDKIKGISLDSKAFDQYVKITDKRLDTLEGTVTQVIETLKGVDSSTDLSSIGKAFDNLKEKVLANNAAIKEMVDTASDLGAKVKIDVINETEIDNMLAKAKEIKTIFEEDFSSNVRSKSGYDKLGKELEEVNSQVKKLKIQRDSIEDKNSIEYLKIDAERTELLAKRYELAQKIISIEEKEPDFLNDGSYNKMAAQVEKVTDKIVENIDKNITKLSELKRAQKEGFSIASSSEMEGAKGNIPITASLKITTTSEQMFEAIKKRLADVQEKINNQTLVVPVRYTLGTPRENAENPLAPTNKEIKDAQKGIDFNWDKTYAKIEKQAINEAEKAAKNAINSVQAEMDNNPVAIKFDIPDSEKKRVSELLAENFLSTQINIGSVLQEAVSSAKELRDLMQEVYDTSIKDDTGSYLQRIRETTKQLAQAEKKEEKPSKKTKSQITNEVKEQANELHSQIQDSFDKNKIKIKLKLEETQLDSIRNKIANANLDKSLDIAGSLKEAVIASHNIAENLNSIKETNIKITGGKGSSKDFENVKSQTQTLLMATSQLDEKLDKVQNSIKNIGKKDSGINDLTGDFDRIISKLDEMISTSRALVEDIRLDVSVIDTSFKELGNTINSVLDREEFGTITNLTTELQIGFNGLITTLMNVINAIDRVKASSENISKQTFDTQLAALGEIDNKSLEKTVELVKELDTTLQSIQQSSSAVKDITNIKNIFDSLNIKDEKLEKIKKIPDVLKAISEQTKELNNLPTSKFVEQIVEIAKQGEGLKALAEVLSHSQKEIKAAIEISQKKPNEAYQNLQTQLKEATQIEKIFNNLSKAGTFETSQPKEYAEVLELIRSNLEEIQQIRNFHANDDKTSDATIGQIYDSRRVESLIEDTKTLFDWIENIKVSNKELISQLDKELKITGDFKKQFQKLLDKGGISERNVSSDYIDSIRQIRDILEESQKYDGLKVATQDDITNIKNLNSQLSTVFRTIESISSFSNDIENSIKIGLAEAKRYEGTYSRHWGFGKIEEGYTSEYGSKLREIRQTLDEIEQIRERFDNKVFLQEDANRVDTLNKNLQTMFEELVKIEQISKPTTTTNLQNKIGQYIQKNTRLTSEMYTELIGYYKELGDGSKLTKQRVNEIATAFNNVSLAAKTAGLEGAGFLDAIKNKLKYGWAQSLAMFFSFYDIIRYIREISGTVTELNSSLIELAKVSDASIGELYRDFSDFRDIAEQTGGTINDIINSTADWARNGYNLPNSKELARLSSIFQNIGDGLSEAQANEYLVSTLKGFNFDDDEVVERAIEIMDKINNVSNNAASSVANIGEALERSSSAFGAANTNLSEAVALLTSANEVLQNPETVGTAFKSMSARLRSSTTELEELGEETTLTTSKLRALVQALTGVDIQKDENTFKSIYDILLEIGKEWENLTDVEQASLSEALFGKRNSQVGFAILNNVDRLQEIYALAENSEGSAMAEQEKYLEGVQYRIDQFQASVENLANTFMSSDFLKGMVQTGTSLVDILADIIDNLGTIPALIGAIGTAIGSKQNLFFNLEELGISRNDKVLPLVPNSDLGALASTNATKQLKALATEYANLGTTLSNTGLSQKEFIAKVSEGNIEFATWLEDVGKDAPNQLKNYQKGLVTTTLKTMGLRVVTMALQGALFAIAGVILTKVVSAISDWVHANERAIETGEEASKTITDINNNLKTQQQTVEDSAKRFAELSQGVDQLTGKNLSLSDEDYQEFLDISNQLADVFPTLSYHYDENNNKIVDLNGSVSDITSSLQNLLKVEQDLARQKILENMDEVFKGAKATASEYNEEIQDLNIEAQNLNSKIEQAKTQLNNTGSITIDESDIESFKRNLDALGILYQGFRENINNTYTISIAGYESLSDEVKSQILNGYSNDLEDIQNEFKNIYKEKNQSMSSALSEGIAAWLYSDWNYAKLDEGLQANIQKMINNLDWSSLNFKDWNEAQGFLSDLISNISDNEADFTTLFNLGTQFNNGEITWGEFQEKMKSLYSIIEVLGLTDKEKEEVQKAFKILFDFEVDDENNVTNSYVENLRERFEKQGVQNIDEIIGKLTFDDIKALYNNSIDWKEFLKIHNLDNQVKYIKQRVRELSDVPFEINFDSSVISDAAEGISSLQSLYQSFYDAMQEGKVGEELAVQFKDVDELKEKLGNVSEYQDIWDEFYDTVTDGSHSFEEMEDSLNKVLTAYVNAKIDLENFDRAQADAISTQLQLAGVTKESADAYVDAYANAASAIEQATNESFNFVDATYEEINATFNLGEQSEATAQLILAYALQKKLANGYTISTAADVDNLLVLANAANVSIKALTRYAELKATLAEAEKTGDASLIRNVRRTIDEYVKTIDMTSLAAEVQVSPRIDSLNMDRNKLKSSKSGGGSSKESDPWKDAYDKELAALDHLHEMELISDIQYYEEREKLNDKYFKDNTKYTEEYNKNLEEIYKGFQSAYKQYVDDMSDYWKKSLDAGKISFQQYCNNMKSMLDDLHNARKIDDQTYYSELAEYYGTIVENYDKVISAVQRRIKKEIDGLEKEKDRLKENYELRKKTIQSQIDSIQAEIDALEDANKRRQEALDLQKALYDLNRAENQRNRFVYNSDKGFIYEASEADIKEAQDNLEDVRYQQKVSALEQQITSLEEQIDLLDNELDELTARLDKQIDDLQAYSDRWGEVADKYREAQEDMIAAAILGSNWQNEILALNESTLSAFTTNYINMQAQQAQAAINAANDIVNSYQRQIQALNEWKEAQATAAQTGSSTSNNGGKTTVSNTPVKVNSVKYNAPTQKVQRGSNQYMNPNTKNQRIKQYSYGSGTDNAKPGIHEIAESGKEIVLDNYGNAYLADGHQLHKFEGGEKVYDANETKELLNGKYIPIDSILPNYSSMLKKVLNSNVTNNYSPTKALVTPKNNNQLNKVDNSINVTIGDIHVTEVDDASQFARVITNELPNALLQELRRK